MKTTFLAIACLALFSVAGFAQTPPAAPVATDQQKVAILAAQHKRDLVVKQQSDLALQIVDLQKKITDESTRLAKALDEAEAAYKVATNAATSGVDAKLWQWNYDSLTFTAVPAPAAPANASTQPAKPAPSPGAAAPPVQQAKK